MSNRIIVYIVLVSALISCCDFKTKNNAAKGIAISWVDNLSGDFSFSERWSYPEGVYRNEFGQLSCDGICPPEVDGMKDKFGRIFQDSLSAFYRFVDTTHQFHSIQSEAWTYEWAGTNFVTAFKTDQDTTVCFTHTNSSTHSSLRITMFKNTCIPIIELTSIAQGDNRTYACKSGHIEIDKSYWEKGILKAEFRFNFDHKENPSQAMYWKGRIFTVVQVKWRS